MVEARFEGIADFGELLFRDRRDFRFGKFPTMAIPLFPAIGAFNSGSVFPMPLSIPIPALAEGAVHRWAVVAVKLAISIPGLGTLSGPLLGRTVLAMKFAFVIAPLDRAVPKDFSDGAAVAFRFHSLPPGFILTLAGIDLILNCEIPFLDGMFPTKEAAMAGREIFKSIIPLGRLGRPEEIFRRRRSGF